MPCRFLCIAVNLFVLISGYWSIRLTVKNVLNLYFLCLFYNLLAFVVLSYTESNSIKDLVKCFFITKTDNWFFPTYFWLMFFAPICNFCIQSMEINKLRIVVGLLVFLNVFSGYFAGFNANANGYTVQHLILIYMIGGYIQRDVIELKSKICIFGYVLIAVINALLCFFFVKYTHLNGMYFFGYNNPLVIVESVLVFLFFKNIQFQSKSVNSLAKTVVAVLLIQDVVLRNIMVENLKSRLQDSYLSFLSHASLWLIFFFVVAYVIEQIRRRIANRIIEQIIGVLPKKISKIQL